MIFHYPYVTVIKHTDGDSGWIEIDFGFKLKYQHKFRLARINAPETGQPGHDEAAAALGALVLGKAVEITSKGVDKWDRCLCEMTVGGINVSDELLRLGLVKAYA